MTLAAAELLGCGEVDNSGTDRTCLALCDSADLCLAPRQRLVININASFAHTSPDGWNWGDPTDSGKRPTTVDGKYFQHAPNLMWSKTPGQFGRLFLIGQITLNADGSVAAENGNVVMANAGDQFWYAIPAPAPVSPAPYDNFCPNYSSPLVPLDNGSVALEFASRYDGATCRTYFARGPLLGSGDATGIQSGNTYRLIDVQSGLCLDVATGSSAPGGRIQQSNCNGLAPQKWTFWQAAEGTFSRKAQNSGLCLTLAKTGALIEQQPCDNSPAQSWSPQQVGLNNYVLKNPDGKCLDDAAGSTTPGTTFKHGSATIYRRRSGIWSRNSDRAASVRDHYCGALVTVGLEPQFPTQTKLPIIVLPVSPN